MGGKWDDEKAGATTQCNAMHRHPSCLCLCLCPCLALPPKREINKLGRGQTHAAAAGPPSGFSRFIIFACRTAQGWLLSSLPRRSSAMQPDARAALLQNRAIEATPAPPGSKPCQTFRPWSLLVAMLRGNVCRLPPSGPCSTVRTPFLPFLRCHRRNEGGGHEPPAVRICVCTKKPCACDIHVLCACVFVSM